MAAALPKGSETILLHNVVEAEVAFLQKPAGPSAILEKVRQVLDAPIANPAEIGR